MKCFQLWERIGDFSGRCDKYTGLSQLPIFEYPNLDDSKFHMLPVNVCFLFTFTKLFQGEWRFNNCVYWNRTWCIGRTKTETGMEIFKDFIWQDLGNNASFYGADPIAEKNKELFEPLGKFFSLAISGYTGLKTASVLTEKGIFHIGI